MELFVETLGRAQKFKAVASLTGVQLRVTVVRPSAAAAHAVVGASPQRRLPCLATPQGCLNGSASILRYLAGLREDLGLLGVGLAGEGEVDALLEWSLVHLDGVAALLSADGPVLAECEEAQLAGEREDKRVRLPPMLHFLNAHLLSRTYMAGQRLSIADVALGAALSSVWERERLHEGSAAYPHLTRWFMTFCSVFPDQAPPLQQQGASAGGGSSSSSSSSSSAGAALAAPQERSPMAALLDANGSARVPSSSATRIQERFSRHRARVADLLGAGEEAIGSVVTVCGWLRTVREGEKGAIYFLAVNDGSCFASLQVVVERGKSEGIEALAGAGGTGASVRVVGAVVKSLGKGQSIEVAAQSVRVLGRVHDPLAYPLAKKKHTLEHLRDIQHLRPRTNTMGAVSRVRNACAFATHTFFNERGFLYVHTPIVTTNDCEGAGEMFSVTTLLPKDPKGDLPRVKETGAIDFKRDFFGRQAGLTVSGQLQVEAFACSMSDVYTFGPTFRAEDSHTSRHLAEFWMIEPEISFATLAEDMALAEDYLKFCTQWVLDHCSEDLDFFEATFEKGLKDRLRNVVAEPFQVLPYTEAIELLLQPQHQAAGKFTEKVFWGCDLASEHERYITEKVFKKPVILINYPKDIKSFYMKLNPDGKV